MHLRVATCPADSDPASLLRRAPVLSYVPWLQTYVARLGYLGSARRGTCGSTEALPNRNVGSRAIGHVAAHRCTSCSLSWLKACMRVHDL
jgi:hypothetical protein